MATICFSFGRRDYQGQESAADRPVLDLLERPHDFGAFHCKKVISGIADTSQSIRLMSRLIAQVGYRDAQLQSNMLKPTGADARKPRFVFVHLLRRDAEIPRQFLLAHSKPVPVMANALTDVRI